MRTPVLSVYNYDVIGMVTVKEAELAGRPTIAYSGPMANFFIMADGKRPPVKVNRSAISVTVTNLSGAVRRIFTALITKVARYSIDKESGGNLDFEFEYDEIPTEAVSGNVYRLEPVPVAALKAKSYMFIAYEGDPEYVAQWVSDNMKVFSHGSGIYRLYGAMASKETLAETDAAIEPLITKVIVLAYQDDVPNLKEFYDCYTRFCRMTGDIAVSYGDFASGE